ncbi:MAG: hypothetical protein A2287_06830 [Candidatus Melainabacteria bacterium RIFOXYA12_FULL_32_12]|nr:MAG: hypothetical protein A2104_07415 [Candidatus Melainabacteria bacterium GWF2_32_7]OGI17381.1 MAG: hypothetical protein A2255_09145 [Candidatus Melainabacteria bacterium RIFOXYA2_FULL_32_9]OGI25316.1 MAG: hypothetical protein A2287_06830 [Candidatus Melainabacteria bacterium RIFOXYA12_FULL_32_12]
MKLLKGFVKLIEAISLLLVPIIMFYWFLTLINLQAIKPFIAILGYVFSPFLSFIKVYANFNIKYEDITVDFAPFILASIFVVVFFVFSGFEKILDNVELMIKENKKKIQEAREREQQELQRMKYLEELAKNKITYLVLKFRQKETANAYLYVGREDVFGEGILGTMVNDIINKSKGFNGRQADGFEGEDGACNFIFYNIIDAIDYAFYVHNKVVEINKEVLDQSKRFYYGIACHCSYSEATEGQDFVSTTKFLNLGGDNEVIVSELFKKKYEALKEDTNLIFESKGIYNIEDKQVEIFDLKVK